MRLYNKCVSYGVLFIPRCHTAEHQWEQDAPAGGFLGCSLHSHRPVTASLCENESIQQDKVGAGYVLRRLIKDSDVRRV